MKDCVIGAGENVGPFHSRRQPVKKFALCFETNDPIFPRAYHQRRYVYCARIGEQSFRGVVKIEKHVDRDLPKDE